MNHFWPGKLDRDHNLSAHLQLLRSDVAPDGDAARGRSNPRMCQTLVKPEQIETGLGLEGRGNFGDREPWQHRETQCVSQVHVPSSLWQLAHRLALCVRHRRLRKDLPSEVHRFPALCVGLRHLRLVKHPGGGSDDDLAHMRLSFYTTLNRVLKLLYEHDGRGQSDLLGRRNAD